MFSFANHWQSLDFDRSDGARQVLLVQLDGERSGNRILTDAVQLFSFLSIAEIPMSHFLASTLFPSERINLPAALRMVH